MELEINSPKKLWRVVSAEPALAEAIVNDLLRARYKVLAYEFRNAGDVIKLCVIMVHESTARNVLQPATAIPGLRQ